MDKPLPFIAHLTELRKTLLVCFIALIGASALCFPFSPRLLDILKAPAGGRVSALFYFSPEEAFLVYMRIGFCAGLLLAFPVIAYAFWSFIAPAFSKKVRIHTVLFAAACFIAFIMGCMFGYFALLPSALHFLLGIGGSNLQPLISAGKYVSFTTGLILACGIIFLLPVFVFFLARCGLVTAGFLRRYYPYAVVAIFIIAAAITPTTDAFNMMIVAIPLLVLYEVSIWIAFFSQVKSKPKDDGYGENN